MRVSWSAAAKASAFERGSWSAGVKTSACARMRLTCANLQPRRVCGLTLRATASPTPPPHPLYLLPHTTASLTPPPRPQRGLSARPVRVPRRLDQEVPGRHVVHRVPLRRELPDGGDKPGGVSVHGRVHRTQRCTLRALRHGVLQGHQRQRAVLAVPSQHRVGHRQLLARG